MRLRLLADENVYREIVEEIRSEGWDVKTVSEYGKGGTSDDEVMRLARIEKRVLLTFDRDFADIRHVPHDIPGVIVLRLGQMPIERSIKRIIQALHGLTEDKFAHQLIVITPSSTRRRSLEMGNIPSA